jgi:hypothetical protein
MKNGKHTPTKKRSWPVWLDRRTLILLVIATLFLAALTMIEPLPRPERAQTEGEMTVLTPPPSEVPPGAPTLLPQELLENVDQTLGIILGGTIIVMVVVIGVFTIIRRR